MQFSEDMLYLAVGNKLHIYDISISFDKELKTIQEMKNINFVFIDGQSRLFTVQDKTVSTKIECKKHMKVTLLNRMYLDKML